jgi:hypothetical protein
LNQYGIDPTEAAWYCFFGMGTTNKNIKDVRTEEKELQDALRVMGDVLRASNGAGKSGLSYGEFKAQFRKKLSKAATPSHAH